MNPIENTNRWRWLGDDGYDLFVYACIGGGVSRDGTKANSPRLEFFPENIIVNYNGVISSN